MNAPHPTTLRTARQLVSAGLVPPEARAAVEAVAARYALSITPEIAGLISADAPDGPIARQYLPSAQELEIRSDEQTDPIGDHAHSPVKGIVHRYPDRALLMPTQVCAVYCRFCFRRDSVGPGAGALSDAELETALDYIRATPAIWEVILTGGDPLILSPRRLSEIVGALDLIPHVAVIRFHSRVPIAAPERVGDELLAALSATSKPIYLSVHCNHASELTANVVSALRRLRGAGVTLLSQSVLLRGVNDSVAALEALFRGLAAAGVKPYYLHHLDHAPGTARFRVPLLDGQSLFKALRGKVSGLALPVFVLDIPGGAGKVPVSASHVLKDGHTVMIEDPRGNLHTLERVSDSQPLE